MAGSPLDEQPDPDPLRGRCYREIRSARFPHGLPDRSDATVLEAFDGAWLLIDHSPTGVQMVGLADDYDEARAWLSAALPSPAAAPRSARRTPPPS